MSYNPGSDQAAGLRRLLGQRETRYFAFLSAITAPQKNALLFNLASALVHKAADVHLLDASHNHEGIADYLGCPANQFLFNEQGQLTENGSYTSPQGIRIDRLSQRPLKQICQDHALFSTLSDHFKSLQNSGGFCLIDCRSDLDNPLKLEAISGADIVVIVSPTVDSIKQAYSQIKIMHMDMGPRQYHLLVIDASIQQAKLVLQNLNRATVEHLSLPLSILGCMSPDPTIQQAMLKKASVVDLFPGSKSASAFRDLAGKLFLSQSNVSQFQHSSRPQPQAASSRDFKNV